MRLRIPAVLLALALLGTPALAGEGLRIGGTGGASALMDRLGHLFTAQTGIPVTVVYSMGSAGGISAAADGVLGIAISGRPLSAAEQARGLAVAATLRTPYVLATSHPAPPAMSGRDIVAIYAAADPVWPDGTRVRLILRPRAESDNEVLAAMFPGMADALAHARTRAELPVAGTDQDNAELAEKLPGSLIGTTFTQITIERRDLRLIAIDGVAPGVAAFTARTYPYAKVLHVVTRRAPDAAAARFLGFLTSAEGLRALAESGCLPGVE